MKTEWVKVCVRPEQSFTRAILEIYMNDGGTLGEVIHALRRQKQYRIIQVGAEAVQDHTGDLYERWGHPGGGHPCPQEAEAVQDHSGGGRSSTGSYR